MKIAQNPVQDVMVLELSGKVMGGPDYEKYHSLIKELLAQDHRKFVLDFRGVDWINSTGVGILMGAYQSIRNAEGTMKLCNLNKRSLSVLYVTHLDKIFAACPTRAEALKEFGVQE